MCACMSACQSLSANLKPIELKALKWHQAGICSEQFMWILKHKRYVLFINILVNTLDL